MRLLSQMKSKGFNRERETSFKVTYANELKNIRKMFVQAGQRIENSEENYINIRRAKGPSLAY